jgi:hypothetical protein
MGRPRVTHCYMGHEYTPENTRTWRNKSGVVTRSCRTCRNTNDRLNHSKPKEKIRCLPSAASSTTASSGS